MCIMLKSNVCFGRTLLGPINLAWYPYLPRLWDPGPLTIKMKGHHCRVSYWMSIHLDVYQAYIRGYR